MDLLRTTQRKITNWKEKKQKPFKDGKEMEQQYAINDFDYRRFYERKMYQTEIVFSHADHLYAGSMRNISLGGAYIETYCVNQFSPRDIVTISIPFSTGKNNIKRKGCVKWLNDVGFAVEFI